MTLSKLDELTLIEFVNRLESVKIITEKKAEEILFYVDEWLREPEDYTED